MSAPAGMSLAEEVALRDRCTVFLAGHGPVTASGMLAGIPADTVPDRYGDGGVVAELEAEIAGLLGKPAAAFWPSGTMAQQSAAWRARRTSSPRRGSGGTAWAARCSDCGRTPRRR